MNVYLQRFVLFKLILFGIPIFLHAQHNEHVKISTTINQIARYSSIESNYIPASIINNAKNGVAKTEKISSNLYDITYTPNESFLGKDTFVVARFPNGAFSSYELVLFTVTVEASKVTAFLDHVTTTMNNPITIDVLANDYSSLGHLMIKGISLVNSGVAEIVDDFIIFTPNSDFQGIAYFNYSACDEVGACSQGTVSVNVVDDSVEGERDTLTIFTKKNQAQTILAPAGYEVIEDPENGSFSNQSSAYTPYPDFVGPDAISFSDGINDLLVQIEVLDFVVPKYAVDDKVFTTPYSAVEFNVLDNDLSSSCYEILTQPAHGTIEEAAFPMGTINYSPSEGFLGVDEFTYSVKPPLCNGEPEVATVQVFVSNYEPASSKYFMTTLKQTPLVIAHDIPVSSFGFEVKDQGEHGEAFFLPGEVDTTIYGQRVQGYNIILYVPDEEVISAQDEFEVEYCLSYNGTCAFSKAVKVVVLIQDSGDQNFEPSCIDDCVWPGDTNYDGVVSMEDLLPLGLEMGQSGPPRSEADLSIWYGQFAEDWEGPLDLKGTNLKHVDTDGDSLVTAFDTMAISKFYGYTHDFVPVKAPTFGQIIRLQGDVTAFPGDVVELELVMGDPQNPAIDIYGFTMPLEYNPDYFAPGSAQIRFDGNSWLSYNSPILHLAKNVTGGRLEAGFTRTNGVSASGYGKIGTVNISVVIDLEGARADDDEITVRVGDGIANVTDSRGTTFGAIVEGVDLKIKLKKEQASENTPIDPNLLKVYPNPARDLLNVHLNGLNEFERVAVYNLTGQLLFDTGRMQNNHAQLDIRNLDNGMYILNVYTQSGIINKKFEVIKN